MSILLREARTKALEALEEGPERECECCMVPFVAAKGFERLCPVCFKLDRGYDLYGGDKALLRLQERYRKQATEMAQLTARYTRIRQKAKALMQAAASPLTTKKVEKLIRLCHPDKHGGSALATEVTQWLLDQRRKK